MATAIRVEDGLDVDICRILAECMSQLLLVHCAVTFISRLEGSR